MSEAMDRWNNLAAENWTNPAVELAEAALAERDAEVLRLRSLMDVYVLKNYDSACAEEGSGDE